MAPPRRSRVIKPDPLVAEVVDFVRKYVVMKPEQLLAVSLWVIHTHCVEEFDQTPYLAVTSPEKQCGKSRLLEVLELLVARPWATVLPSEAVVFRTVDARVPTMLLDETDTIFNPKSAERYEGLRAILNSGHRRGAKVSRCIGISNNLAEFSTFCPKVLAGIGTLPDTISDRSVPIRLERRTRDEPVARFFQREAKPVAEHLKARIEVICETKGERFGAARPKMPEALTDRMQEGCEPLVAIADALGYAAEAREAFVALLTAERLDNTETLRLRLLRDIRTVFAAHKDRHIATVDLIDGLVRLDEAPWSNYFNRTIESRDLSTLLKGYGITSGSVRLKDADGRRRLVKKGYKRDDFVTVWERYL